ncbi:uncharacterized protein LOC110990176 [Acanthaster planci]|uniref:Uncharacterized protein LOC110990176 n=1 Tax=Acanthaster planci TaxID=133434 RepID=A0A8B8A047_ACAPL|nr:uncharacterized protein LOC110990176 [Acanthaster planci]
MAKCQVPECYNRRDKDKGRKSFFRIPDPAKGYRDLAQRWLANIGSGKKVEGFVFSKNKLVCEDHFELTCFREDLQARVLGYRPARKKLKPGSVPTLFESCRDGRRDPQRLWPSQHLNTVARKIARKRSRPKAEPSIPRPSELLPSSCGPAYSQGNGQQEAPPSLQPDSPPIVIAEDIVKTERDDGTWQQATRQILTPVVSAPLSAPDTLRLAPGNHLKVRLVEFADKEVQTDPVLILPIRRYDCLHGNRVSWFRGQR